jgi:hypothetical protein
LFRAAGNLGVIKGNIELSGWNDAVAATVRAGIAATIDRLRELLDSYPDPPFDANTIRNIISGLERFDQLMARRNVQAREAYFTAIHGNLQAAMSVIFRSQTGLEYEATCDTFVVNAGFHMGRAQVAADQGNRNALTSAIGSVNLAIRGGIQASEYLGCGFPTFAQWQTLRLNQARTREDMNRAIADASGLIANANGISSPANVIPSSGNLEIGHLKINCGYIVYGFKLNFYAIFRSNGTMENFRTQGQRRLGSENGHWSFNNQTKILSFGGTIYGSFSGTIQPAPPNPNSFKIVGSGNNGSRGTISFSVAPRALPD